MNKLTLSKKGFGIIEALIGAVLVGIVGFALMQVVLNASRGQKSVQSAVDFDILKSSISLLLSSKSCDGAFYSAGTPVVFNFPATLAVGDKVIDPTGTPSLAGIPFDQIKMNATTLAEVGKAEAGGMKITSMEFIEATYEGDQVQGTPPITYKTFTTLFRVEGEKQGATARNYKIGNNFAVRVLVNPLSATTGSVDKCYATLQSAPGIAKAWAVMNIRTTSPYITVLNGFNIASVSSTGVGIFAITTVDPISYASGAPLISLQKGAVIGSGSSVGGVLGVSGNGHSDHQVTVYFFGSSGGLPARVNGTLYVVMY